MFAAKNLLLAPSGATAIPAYLATGNSSTTTSAPATYSDTVPSGSNVCGLIWVTGLSTSTTLPTASASIGAASATQVAGIKVGATTYSQYLYCFSVLGPPSGTQTVSFTMANVQFFPAICTVYYSGVTSVGTATTLGSQTSASPSMSVSSSSGNLYGNAFAYIGSAAGNTFSGYNQTQRRVLAETSSPNEPLMAGDAAGNGGTLTFSTNRSSTTNTWGGIVVPLL